MNKQTKFFGCLTYVYLHKQQRSKLSQRAERYVFLSYIDHQNGYQRYNSQTKQIFTSIDVISHETLINFSTDYEIQGGNYDDIQTFISQVDTKFKLDKESKN